VSLSESLFQRAKLRIPGGVNSPVRFYAPYPLFISSGKGSKIVTSDHDTLIDYCMGYGGVIFGHAFAEISDAVKDQLDKGNLFCMPTQLEVELAELLSKVIPNTEQVRLVNTGSEANLHAIRLARSITKKAKILKFDGCYHGSFDEVLVNAGSGAVNIQPTDNDPHKARQNTLLTAYNDIGALEELIKKRNDIACVIVEPVIANMGLIVPKRDFLSKLRKITAENDIILIFDEVVTGFRLSLGGAAEYFGIKPDISTFGKAIGNGFPIAAITGKRSILECLSPSGSVYEGSTYAGNPICVTASLVTVQRLSDMKAEIYPKMSRLCDSISTGISDEMNKFDIPFCINHIGSMFQIYLTERRVENANDARTSKKEKYKELFNNLVKFGIFVPPSQFETCFFSVSHTEEDVDLTIDAYSNSLRNLKTPGQ